MSNTMDTIVRSFWDLVMGPFIWSIVGAFVLSALGCIVVRQVKIIDTPIARSAHSTPTPKSGGLAIMIGFFAALFIIPHPPIAFMDTAWFLNLTVFGAFILGMMGLWDDIWPLPSLVRLMFQLGIAGAVVLFGLSFPAVSLWHVGVSPLFWPLTWMGLSIFWIVLMINTVNFMDGINNLTAGVMGVALLFLSALLFLNNQDYLAALPLLLMAALWGFWVHNGCGVLFMGDVGSQFVGAFMGFFTLFACMREGGGLPVVCMPMLFFLYLFDTIFTRLWRMAKGCHPFDAHREHLYQLLDRSGTPHGIITGIYMGFFTLQGITSVFLFFYEKWWVLAYIIHLMMNSFFATWVRRRARKNYIII